MGLVGEFYLIKPKPASDQYEYATARTADWVEPSEAQTANAWKSALLIPLALGPKPAWYDPNRKFGLQAAWLFDDFRRAAIPQQRRLRNRQAQRLGRRQGSWHLRLDAA